jgi:hypothetical protein
MRALMTNQAAISATGTPAANDVVQAIQAFIRLLKHGFHAKA